MTVPFDPHEFDLDALDWATVEKMTQQELEALLLIAQAQANEWKWTEKQKLANEAADRCFETLYGGAAGGGKSAWILRRAWDLSIKYPGHRSLLLRRTYPELEESLILASLETYDQSLATYKVADRRWVFNNGSSIKFGHMAEERDRFAYQSAAYCMIGFDELAHFTEEMYDYLLSRCRVTKKQAAAGMRPHMIAATNPGGVGGSWIKERWINAAPWGTIFEGERGLTRCFIQAKVSDNPYIDEDYAARLAGLKNEVERRQLLDGDWDAWDGRFFDSFDRSVHVIEPFEIPEWWPRERGLDYGYSAPFFVVWGAWAPSGELFIYKEATATELTPSQQVDLVNDVNGDDVVAATYADPSIWSNTGIGEPVAVQYAKKGLRVQKAMNARISGWAAVRERMRVTTDADGLKRTNLLIFDSCRALIKELSELPRSEKNPEDCDTRANDHGSDALRYLCATHGRRGREPAREGSEVDRILARADRHRRDRRHHLHPLGRF